MPEPQLEQDNAALNIPLDQLGWVGADPDDPKVVELRNYLEANNGIKGLEVVSPDEVERAAQIFWRDGFVVVRDVLSPEQLDYMRAGCDRVIHEIMAMDRNRRGNRGSHRYSFGSASKTGQLLHHPEWAMLVDLPTVTPIVSEIFGAPTYMCRGGAGDVCLPGAVEYQRLHSDMGDRRVHGDKVSGSFHDHRGILTYRDLPVPSVVCNFLMVDFTRINGPTRQIPGTQHNHDTFPRIVDEPEWMKLSTVCPAPAGSVLIRDIRAWHGGTPNLSNEVRAIPNVEFWAPWYREPVRKCMTREIYDALSDHGKRLCEFIVVDSGETLETGYLEDLGKTPRLMRPEHQMDSA
ncbi:MAG: phytanoyl-CoA dioxygenase family protein [Pseudomonadales bacterium]|jgi:ectoine hydroxylase-related dioxygenase (phytanoyl-CoA dioxygenase family)|nr:phytanoyl-CoA dioxygenase family protein [Pseudomonadales bacterium]